MATLIRADAVKHDNGVGFANARKTGATDGIETIKSSHRKMQFAAMQLHID